MILLHLLEDRLPVARHFENTDCLMKDWLASPISTLGILQPVAVVLLLELFGWCLLLLSLINDAFSCLALDLNFKL